LRKKRWGIDRGEKEKNCGEKKNSFEYIAAFKIAVAVLKNSEIITGRKIQKSLRF
jgi:hypothetical protein